MKHGKQPIIHFNVAPGHGRPQPACGKGARIHTYVRNHVTCAKCKELITGKDMPTEYKEKDGQQ